MCWTLCCCFPRRSCRAEESFSDCRTSSQITMRTETDGFKVNFRPDHKWFNFRRNPKPQTKVDNASKTDGHHSPVDENPQEGLAVKSVQNVILTYEQMLEANCLCEADRLLIQREERLFGEIKESEALARHEEEVRKLEADRDTLKGLVLQTLQQSLCQGDGNSKVLKSAVAAVNQEEDQDRLWTQRDGTPPNWRSGSGWKSLHDTTLRSLVEDRLDNPQTPPADHLERSSIQADIHSMGRQLKEDLLYVVSVVKGCYPPEMDICNFYARLYHQTLSAQLTKITDFGLGDKDCTFLLRWVNEYYPQVLQKPELAGDIGADVLGKLLPKKIMKPLEDQYLDKQQEELTTFVGRVLEEAKQKWDEGEEPTKEDGYFISPVAYDIIQLINGMVTAAEKVVGDLHKAQIITCQLSDLMQRFKIFQNDVIRQNKRNSRPFVKANLGCIEQFRDVLDKRRRLFPVDVQETCVRVLTDMKQSAHAYLLKPVHDVLKPQYRKLGTSDWLNKPLFEKLLVSIEKELEDLQGSIESCHQKLLGQFHQEVSAEYVKRLLKGQVKLKDKEQQLKAYAVVRDNAESLHDLFARMGSEEHWLKEILTKIAEVLKLQDLPAIQMQVASLGTEYPDLSEKHVLALLKLKSNLSKAEKKTITDILSDTREQQSANSVERPFFSNVQVK